MLALSAAMGVITESCARHHGAETVIEVRGSTSRAGRHKALGAGEAPHHSGKNLASKTYKRQV
jgi:hypothetical protein